MIEMHPEVRIAKVEPGDAVGRACLLQLCNMLHTETPHAPLCPERLAEGVDDVLARGTALVSVMPDGRIAGTVGLVKQAPWFSRQQWLTDQWFFVHPDCRRTPHAKMLLRASKAVAGANGLTLQMTVTGFGRRIAGIIRLFARELGEANGALFTVKA